MFNSNQDASITVQERNKNQLGPTSAARGKTPPWSHPRVAPIHSIWQIQLCTDGDWAEHVSESPQVQVSVKRGQPVLAFQVKNGQKKPVQEKRFCLLSITDIPLVFLRENRARDNRAVQRRYQLASMPHHSDLPMLSQGAKSADPTPKLKAKAESRTSMPLNRMVKNLSSSHYAKICQSANYQVNDLCCQYLLDKTYSTNDKPQQNSSSPHLTSIPDYRAQST